MMGSSAGGFNPVAIEAFFGLLQLVADPSQAKKMVTELDQKLKSLIDRQKALDEVQKLSNEERNQLDEQSSSLQQREADHRKNIVQLEADREQAARNWDDIKAARADLEQQRQALDAGSAELSGYRAEISRWSTSLDARSAALERGEEELKAKIKRFEDDKVAAETALANARAEFQQNVAQVQSMFARK